MDAFLWGGIKKKTSDCWVEFEFSPKFSSILRLCSLTVQQAACTNCSLLIFQVPKWLLFHVDLKYVYKICNTKYVMCNTCAVYIARFGGFASTKHKLCQKFVQRPFFLYSRFYPANSTAAAAAELGGQVHSASVWSEMHNLCFFPPERSLLSWYYSFHMIMLFLNLRVAVQKNAFSFSLSLGRMPSPGWCVTTWSLISWRTNQFWSES